MLTVTQHSATVASRPFLSARLRELLSERGWEQKELSRRSLVAQSTISKHINGRQGVDPENQERYARAFGITVLELVGEDGDEDQLLRLILHRLEEAQDGAADRLEVLNETLLGIQSQLAELRASLGLRDVRGRGRGART